MKRWLTTTGGRIENTAIDAFLAESHEDGHGAFVIERFDQFNLDKLDCAADGTEEASP
jgi:Ca2+-binding EF-hand superfamily protein